MGKVRLNRIHVEDSDNVEKKRSLGESVLNRNALSSSTRAFNVSCYVDGRNQSKRTPNSMKTIRIQGKKRPRRSGITSHQTSTFNPELLPKRLCIRSAQSEAFHKKSTSTPVISFPNSVEGSDDEVASVEKQREDKSSEESSSEVSSISNDEDEAENDVSERSFSEDENLSEESEEERIETRRIKSTSSIIKASRDNDQDYRKISCKKVSMEMEDVKESDEDDKDDIVNRDSNSFDRFSQITSSGHDGLPNGVRLFLHQGSALVTLSDFASITFGGSAWLQTIQGCVQVYGIRLRPSDDPVHLQSVPGSCILLNNAGSTDENGNGDNLHDRMQSIGAGSATERARELISRFPKKTIIVFHGLAITDRYFTGLKPNFNMAPDSTPENMWTNCGFYLTPCERDLKNSYKGNSLKQIGELCDNLIKAASRTAVRICLIGSRNSGKSTMLRVLCNRILHSGLFDSQKQRNNDSNNNKRLKCVPLFILDLDPGQTEFTPSACISLVEVNGPLMGPPGAHQIKPRKSFLLGDSTAGARPEAYVAALTNLMAFVKNELVFNHILIVNTMGWLTGIGEALLGTILDLVKPLKVLSTSDNVKLPLVAWPMKEIHIDLPLMTLNILDGLYTRDSYTKPLKAIDHRRSTVINYFGGINILNKKTIVIPWNSVALHEVSGLCPPQEFLRLMNATVVALVKAPSEMIWKSKSDPTLPMLLRENHAKTYHEALECLGFAFVRAIDTVRKTFQLLSPETEEMVIQHTNALVYCTGQVNITDYFVANQSRDGRRQITITPPYTTTTIVT